jgi:hypothetical protein
MGIMIANHQPEVAMGTDHRRGHDLLFSRFAVDALNPPGDRAAMLGS